MCFYGMCLLAICVSMQAIAVHQRIDTFVQTRLQLCTLAPSETRREINTRLSHECQLLPASWSECLASLWQTQAWPDCFLQESVKTG